MSDHRKTTSGTGPAVDGPADGPVEGQREAVESLRKRVQALQTKLAQQSASHRETLDAHRERAQTRQQALQAKLETLRREKEALAKKGAILATGEDLAQTDGWRPVAAPAAPFVLGRRERIKVLYLNSKGRIAGHLSRALMLHEGIEAECYNAPTPPRRFIVDPHEVSVHGLFSQGEWRSFLEWAVTHYDIVHSFTLPFVPALAACHDWLTETLGRRHVWTCIGLVHHYLKREDVLPLSFYADDLTQPHRGLGDEPGPHRFPGRSFRFRESHIETDPHVVFYSSPEKGAYFRGKDVFWLPCIRDPAVYAPGPPASSDPDGRVRIFVPEHRGARWKGLKEILQVLEGCERKGMPIRVITSDQAGTVLPQLPPPPSDAAPGKRRAYPVPTHLMPELFRSVDLVIDQAVMGSYGNTGIEAMFCGKPVLGQKRYPEIAEAPVVPIEIDTLEAVLADLLQRRGEWAAIGAAGRDYALRTHGPAPVARIAADVYRRLMDEQRH